MKPKPPANARWSRQSVIRLSSTALPLLLLAADDEGLSTIVRRAIVRGAQSADKLDSIWQQVSGEVVPSWQRAVPLDTPPPPAFLEAEYASQALALPLEVGALSAKLRQEELASRLPLARQQSVLLYGDSSEPGASIDGAAQRVFPRALASAREDGYSTANATVFNFEAYVTWRVLQDTLPAAERKKFAQDLGGALLSSSYLRSATLPPAPDLRLPRSKRSLKLAINGTSALLARMQEAGLFAAYKLQLGLGSGTDLFDEGDWQAGGSTSWQFIVSGSTIVGGSQLAQDRTATTGQGAGLFPGQLITAPLAAYLSSLGIDARIDEYFLDNRVGRPDPRTFSDPRYYCDTLIEVVALEEP